MTKSMLVVAGDVSGDQHAAGVVRALRARRPDLELMGIGGDQLQEAGVNLVYHCRDMAVFGLPEVIKRYRFFKGVFSSMVNLAKERQPDVVLLVDYGGFNLRFAEQLQALGLKVVYYVCPQVWASRRGRIKKMAKFVDRLMVIFPFEKKIFEGTGLQVDFVGHPLVDHVLARRTAERKVLGWSGDPKVGLLPGSRRQEIERNLPVMLDAAARLEMTHPTVSFIIPTPSAEATAQVERVLGGKVKRPQRLVVAEGRTTDVLLEAKAAMVTSGTATVEAALAGCPMTVVYKTSPFFYAMGRMLIQIDHIGMVNILAGRTLCREFIQGDATGQGLFEAMRLLLDDTPARVEMVEGLKQVAESLGGGAADRAAEILFDELAATPYQNKN